MKEDSKNITRRSFIGTTGAVAAGLTILPELGCKRPWPQSSKRQAEYCCCWYRRYG
ncbi:MAG: twin-arginine translocation signal domain-containing protein [Marinilabiliales bacterium]|nr:twin-arginine translocation signal domain-containing protein [Marinilabiliales bacterium]